jgi:hypothetical protein
MPEFVINEEVRRQQREKLQTRSLAGMHDRVTKQNRADLEEAERQMAPPVIHVAQCHTCSCPKRFWIERQLLKGASYSAIARSLEQDPTITQKVNSQSIAQHAKNHMPLDQAIVRGIMEEEASLIGQNWEEGVKGAITNRGMLRTLATRGWEDAMSGVTTVEPRDMIQIIRVLNELDNSLGTAATEEAILTVRIFTEAIGNVVTDLLDTETADLVKQALVDEVKRLRARDAIEVEVERSLLPRGT